MKIVYLKNSSWILVNDSLKIYMKEKENVRINFIGSFYPFLRQICMIICIFYTHPN